LGSARVKAAPKMLVKLTQGFSDDGFVATEETHLIYPNTSLHFQQYYGVKIKRIIVEASSSSRLAYSVIEKGGVGQEFVTLRVFAGQSSANIIIKIVT